MGIWLPSTRAVQPSGLPGFSSAFPSPFGVLVPSVLNNGNLATGQAGFGYFRTSVGPYGKTAIVESSTPFALAIDSSKVIPIGNSVTIIYVVSGDVATTGPNLSTGEAGTTGTADFDAYLPYSGDGYAYFRWGGQTDGVTSLKVASAPINGVWLLSTGPAGMQIWRNGVLLGFNSASPTRSSTGVQLEAGASTQPRSYNFSLFYSTANQFSASVNASLSANPWQLFEDELLYIPTSSALYPTLSNIRFNPATSSGGYFAVALS